MIEPGNVVLVDLDSDHSKKHVLAELRAYAELDSVGSYLIVEDAKTGARPLLPEMRQESGEAVDQFLSENSNFVRDQSWTDRVNASYTSEYLRRER